MKLLLEMCLAGYTRTSNFLVHPTLAHPPGWFQLRSGGVALVEMPAETTSAYP